MTRATRNHAQRASTGKFASAQPTAATARPLSRIDRMGYCHIGLIVMNDRHKHIHAHTRTHTPQTHINIARFPPSGVQAHARPRQNKCDMRGMQYRTVHIVTGNTVDMYNYYTDGICLVYQEAQNSKRDSLITFSCIG